MKRRNLLGAVGAGTVGMAGLLGAQERGAGQDATATETAATATETIATTETSDGFDGIESAADRAFATITVGSREGVRNPANNRPHAVRIWNHGGEARAIGLRLDRGGETDAAALDRRVEFPADGFLTLRLLEPADYALSVIPEDGESETTDGGEGETTAGGETSGETIEIARARFDCNDSATEVAIGEDGAVRFRTVSTEIGCPPEVIGRTFTEFRGSCGSADDASGAFGDRSVAVRGSIRAPTPCYGAELARVAIAGPDAVRVTVATTEPTSDACVECAGSIEYDAELAFRDRVPSTVAVVHRRSDGSETVARITRDGTATESGSTIGTAGETSSASESESETETGAR